MNAVNSFWGFEVCGFLLIKKRKKRLEVLLDETYDRNPNPYPLLVGLLFKPLWHPKVSSPTDDGREETRCRQKWVTGLQY